MCKLRRITQRVIRRVYTSIKSKTNKLSQRMTKPTKWHVRPAKTQISLGIRPVWSESLLCAQWIAKDPSFLSADSEESDQTGRMPRLIWVFAGHTCNFVGFAIRWLKFFPLIKQVHRRWCLIRFYTVCRFRHTNPSILSFPLKGHWQTIQTQIKCRRTRREYTLLAFNTYFC